MLSIFFTNKILRERDNKKFLFYKLSVQYMVVKLACVNAAVLFGLKFYLTYKSYCNIYKFTTITSFFYKKIFPIITFVHRLP